MPLLRDVEIVERDDRGLLGEGPSRSPRRSAIYRVDIIVQRLNELCLLTRRVPWWRPNATIGWVIERRDGKGFIARLRSGSARRDIDSLSVQLIADFEPAQLGNRLNGAKADRAGRIRAGTMPRDSATDRADRQLHLRGTARYWPRRGWGHRRRVGRGGFRLIEVPLNAGTA